MFEKQSISLLITFTNSELLSKCEVNLHLLRLMIGVDAGIVTNKAAWSDKVLAKYSQEVT